jgi:hypothetical protein
MWVTVFHKGEPLKKQRLDMVVDEKVIVEGKSTVECGIACLLRFWMLNG